MHICCSAVNLVQQITRITRRLYRAHLASLGYPSRILNASSNEQLESSLRRAHMRTINRVLDQKIVIKFLNSTSHGHELCSFLTSAETFHRLISQFELGVWYPELDYFPALQHILSHNREFKRGVLASRLEPNRRIWSRDVD